MRCRPYRRARCLDGLVRSYRKLSDVSIHCRSDGSLMFKGDSQDLVEAVGNVLENACRYAESVVTIRAEIGRIVVEDDGPGIPSAARREALERGTRLDEAEPGTGIGLAIAAEIVESYGGEIALDAGESGGLRVTVGLPGLTRG